MEARIPSAQERQLMTQSTPDSKISDLGLARYNARVLLRQRFPGFVFEVKSRTSQNGDVQTLRVSWPEVPGAPDRKTVINALAAFYSMASDVGPSEDGMGVFMFRDRFGSANVLALVPRPPKPEDLSVSMHRKLGVDPKTKKASPRF